MLTAEEARKITEEARNASWEEERAHADMLLEGIEKTIREEANKGYSVKTFRFTAKAWGSQRAVEYARKVLEEAHYKLYIGKENSLGLVDVSW